MRHNIIAIAIAAIIIIASLFTMPARAAEIQDLRIFRPVDNGDWTQIQGTLDSTGYEEISAVVLCDSKYAGNVSGRVEVNGMFTLILFNGPEFCSKVERWCSVSSWTS